MFKSSRIDQVCINTIRTLSMDAVQKAKSGHPGTPMGLAPVAYILWSRFLKHNPHNPEWINRDRFILSAGHASMLLYSLLYLTGYKVFLDDLKNFRQLDSTTPGHPEVDLTPGVETTTGPLGQGFANGIGMAIAQKYIAANFNKPDVNLIDYKIYGIVSDGDLMEGVSSEAASLAGHLKLGNIIYIYDNNSVTIEGSTNLSISENILKRFEAYGWHVLSVEDGNDLESVYNAIDQAQNEIDKPSLVSIKTVIGYGSPNKQGTSKCHGSPLGEEEVILAKNSLGWIKPDEKFYVPQEALDNIINSLIKGKSEEDKWIKKYQEYKDKYPEEYKAFEIFINKNIPDNLLASMPEFKPGEQMSTRVASGIILNALANNLPALIGGSADLAPSNNTFLTNYSSFQQNNYAGRNIHFGVREFAMSAICTGMALSNCLIPYCATFMVFSDYMRNAIRMAALMKKQVIYIFTHDSIALGEDGATHQPIEHLAALRSIPDLIVIRPSDAEEVKYAYKVALESTTNPTALILSRQKLPVIDRNNFNSASNLENGAYIISDSSKESPDIIVMASGSEVSLILEAQKALLNNNIDARIVAFPSWELFEKQSDSYKESVLPVSIKKRLVVETGCQQGWEKYIGLEGSSITINHFGKSAPGYVLLEKFGFTVQNIVEKAKELIN
ncbi:MAG: transketolase [Cyanobacteriota bacterium]